MSQPRPPPAAGPTLVWVSVTADPSSPVAGQPFNLIATFGNRGSAAAQVGGAAGAQPWPAFVRLHGNAQPWLALVVQLPSLTQPTPHALVLPPPPSDWSQDVVLNYTAAPGLALLGVSGSPGAVCTATTSIATCTFPIVGPTPARRRLAAAGDPWMQVVVRAAQSGPIQADFSLASADAAIQQPSVDIDVDVQVSAGWLACWYD